MRKGGRIKAPIGASPTNLNFLMFLGNSCRVRLIYYSFPPVKTGGYLLVTHTEFFLNLMTLITYPLNSPALQWPLLPGVRIVLPAPLPFL